MKLALDLVKALRPADVLEMAAANSHRYNAEPVFSKTGTGHLSPTSTEDSAKEGALSTALIRKVTKRAGKEWEALQKEPLTFLEVLGHLRRFHRSAPFLFFNGNTFAELGRGLTHTLFAEVPTLRQKQIASLVAHFIAGLPDVDEIVLEKGLQELAQIEQFQIGDRVATLKKTLTGKIVRLNDDGTVTWKCDQTGSVMIATPQSLIPFPK